MKGASSYPAAGKVLLVASNFPPVRGGSAAVYDNLAREACRRIVVLAPTLHYADGRELAGWREHDQSAPYRIVRRRLLRTPLRPVAADRGLARLGFLASGLALRIATTATVLRLAIRERARTVCVGELVAGGWMLGLLRWAPWIRTVAYVHGEELTTADSYDPDHRRARRALLAADHIVVVSRFTGQAVRALIGEAVASRKLTVIPNGVDPRRFRPRPRRADLIERYGLQDRFVFVSVCRLVEKKGVDQAIRAFARIARDDPETRFLIVGSGPFGPNLRNLAETCGVADRVIFAGEASAAALADHYRLGDVFVMPNRELADGDTEGFGLVFLEANACGLPVIAGRDGGSTDAVERGVNGLVVDGRSTDEIAAAMRRLREDAGLRERLRQGGLVRAAAADWAAKAELFLKVCTAQVSRGPRSSGDDREFMSPDVLSA